MSKKKTQKKWLSPGISSIGLASLFSDAGHEIVTSVLPSFITSTLHASASTLGLIEGLSDGLMGIMKLVGGPLANDPKVRGKLASGGYIGTAIATSAIGLAATVWQAGILRGISWMSRGLRSPARDAMLATLAEKENYGKAYGIERAGDNAGAVIGPLLASGLVAWVGIQHAIYFSIIPGILAAIAITVAAKEARRLASPIKRHIRIQFSKLREAGLFRPLLPVAFFELGNIATTLLILRATDLLHVDGRSLTAAASLAILIYAIHNVFASIAAIVGGHWLDKGKTKIVFAMGVFVYILAYASFAFPIHSWGTHSRSVFAGWHWYWTCRNSRINTSCPHIARRFARQWLWSSWRPAIVWRLCFDCRGWTTLYRRIANCWVCICGRVDGVVIWQCCYEWTPR
jgi:MFS family permease